MSHLVCLRSRAPSNGGVAAAPLRSLSSSVVAGLIDRLRQASLSSSTYVNMGVSSHMLNVPATPSPEPPPQAPQLDHDVVVILAAMLCALVCTLGLNSMLQCVVRCSRRAVADPVGWVAHRRANAGLKREALVALPVATYAASPAQKQASAAAGCAICLSDFADGDRIRVLPVCAHRFHVACVDRWLASRCSCPTCRRRLSADHAAGAGEGRQHVDLQVLSAV